MLAVLLNIKIPGRNFFRGIYFAPWVLSVAVVGLLWWWIFQSQGGLINYYLANCTSLSRAGSQPCPGPGSPS